MIIDFTQKELFVIKWGLEIMPEYLGKQMDFEIEMIIHKINEKIGKIPNWLELT